jgi:serine/threonine protein kinase
VEALQPGDPTLVGSYRLLGRLGSGGMGRVFLGRSPGGRLVAVKLIRADLAAIPDFRGRFAREVGAARRVGGIFTAPVVDADPDGPEPWLVTGYVEGPSLAGAVADQGPLPVPSVLALAAGLAEGLGAIHKAGVVHRDLKPSNVLLANDGPRIIDFGISRAAGSYWLTHPGSLVGSPGFMSPEQAEGHEAGPPSDIFSLGAVLAFAATGENPFGTGSASALLYRVVHGAPTLDGLPAQIRSLIERCLAKDPQQRPTTGQLLAELGTAQPAPDMLRLPAVPRPTLAEPASPSGPPPADTFDGPTTADAEVPAAALPREPSPNAGQRPWSMPRHLSGLWAALALVAILAVATAAAALTSHGSVITPPSRPSLSASSAAASPRAVVEAFFAAINKHDWPKVWQLGGKNLGRSYSAMVAGFHLTKRDMLISLTNRGNLVSARFLAYQTTHAIKTYAATYTVHAGTITAGHQTLLETQG